MQTQLYRFIFTCLLGAIMLSGCSGGGAPAPTLPVPTVGNNPTAPIPTAIPSATPAPTLTPTAAPSPTATLVPSPTATLSPLKAASARLDVQNVGKLQSAGQWGLGAITNQFSLQNGKLVLAVTAEGLYLYDFASLKRIAYFPKATQPRFSDDGRWMVAFSDKVILYDLVNQKEFKSPPVSASATSAAFSADNKFLAVAHSSTDIDVVRLEDMSVTNLTRERTAAYEPQTNQAAFSPDNQFLLTHENGGIVLWNIPEKKLVWYLKNLPQYISSSPFSPDGRYFMSQDQNFTYLRETRFGGVVFSGLGHPSAAPYSADGKLFFLRNKNVATLYTAGEYPGGVVRILVVEGQGEVKFSADSSKFFAGNLVMNLADFKTETLNNAPVKDANLSPAQALELGHISNLKGVAFGKQGELYAWGAIARTVYLLELGSGKAQTIEVAGNQFIANIAFHPESQRLAACTNLGLEIMDMKDRSLKQFGGCAPRGWVAFSPDGSKIARAGLTRVDLLNASDGSTLNSLIEHNIDVNQLAFSADGNWLAVGTIKNRENGYTQVSLWKLNPVVNLVPGFRGQKIPGGGSDTGFYGLAVSPDGQWLLGLTNMLRAWRVADAEQMKFNDQRGDLLVLSPDGSLAATASSGQVGFWSVPNLERVGTLSGAVGQPLGMAFNANGTLFATVNKEGMVQLYSVP